MSFWSRTLNRPELDLDVTEIAKAVYDPVWQGTGNWPFNTAYAGSYPGMRAYVTRLTDLAELEDWIADGLPVALSVCLNRLSGRKGPPAAIWSCASASPRRATWSSTTRAPAATSAR